MTTGRSSRSGRAGVWISLRDNGRSTDVLDPTRGRGLANMRERTRALNGQLTIDRTPGEGGEVILWLPE